MISTYEIQPPGQLRPRLRRVGIRIGRPLDFTRYEGLENDRFVLRSVTDEVMYELMSLSGQEYVDMYATRAKELIAQGSPADSRSMVAPDEDVARYADRAHGSLRLAPTSPWVARSYADQRRLRATASRHRSCASWSMAPGSKTPDDLRVALELPASTSRPRRPARRGTPHPGPSSAAPRAGRRAAGRCRPAAGTAGRSRPRRRRSPAAPAARSPSRAIRSTTSRTWKAIASRVARAMCARVVPRVMPMIRPAGGRVPLGGAEAGQGRHEDDAAGVGHAGREGLRPRRPTR